MTSYNSVAAVKGHWIDRPKAVQLYLYTHQCSLLKNNVFRVFAKLKLWGIKMDTPTPGTAFTVGLMNVVSYVSHFAVLWSVFQSCAMWSLSKMF